ncbi:MAG: hypothetical protein ACXIUQ_14290 [Cecembia sp.]
MIWNSKIGIRKTARVIDLGRFFKTPLPIILKIKKITIFKKKIEMKGILIFNVVLGIVAMTLIVLGLMRGNHLAAVAMGFVLISNVIQIIQEYINIKKSKTQ